MNYLKKYAPLIILIILMITASQFIDSQTIISYKDSILEFYLQNKLLTAFAFFSFYLITVALSLPIATVLTLMAGIIFGPFLATLIVVSSATLGATVIFLIVKKATNNSSIINKYKNSKSLLTLQENIKKDAASYLLFARLVPVFPFVLVNIAPATVGIKTSTYIWTTFIGIIPGTFVYTYLGYQSGRLENISDLVSIEMLSALALLGVFSLTPILIKKLKSKR